MLKYTIKNIIDFPDEIYSKCLQYMSEERQNKVGRFKNCIQKKCTLAGEWIVRQTLAELTGKSPDDIEILTDSKGKPYSTNSDGYFFNITHSDTMVAVAVSDKPVGIDIEVYKKVPLKLAKKVCVKDELMYIFGVIPSIEDLEKEYSFDIIKNFLEIWTLKEAVFKCNGTGIVDFKSINTIKDNIEKIKISTDNYVLHIVTK